MKVKLLLPLVRLQYEASPSGPPLAPPAALAAPPLLLL
jgi:hypothetical protein